MKWSFVIQQKMKAALLLSGIMVLIILSTVLSRSNINDIDKSFSSIYQDRLVPAVDMVHLIENLYIKRLLVEKHLMASTPSTPAEIKAQLKTQNQSIDSLIRNYEKTFLITEEAKSLYNFKNRVSDYAILENRILHLSESGNKEAGSELFNGKGSQTFQRAIACLNELAQIQYTEGQSLVKDSKTESSQFNLISSLQIAVAIVIGLLILGLIHNSKIIQQDRQPFHLN
ncbi:MCP four helix bundle domain-containing protein [Larkinella sp. GY13]|uniref:MCP four helix bundle domain-containing protein n=1 Tax=Larkinella sp. GY13 TaxID=3453720 RepID=UPI003EEDA603